MEAFSQLNFLPNSLKGQVEAPEDCRKCLWNHMILHFQSTAEYVYVDLGHDALIVLQRAQDTGAFIEVG